MLTHLSIKHFIIVDRLAWDLTDGLTVITGETGSGKSIMLHAIELCLGKRIDTPVVQPGHKQCELTLIVRCEPYPALKEWLHEHDISLEDGDCVIRRIITEDGRSRIFVNDTRITAQWLKRFAERIVNFHGQHENQALMKPDYQRMLLDHFAKHNDLVKDLNKVVRDWQATQQKIETLELQDFSDEERIWLGEQIQTLEKQALTLNDYQTLVKQHDQFSHAQGLQEQVHHAVKLLNDDEPALIAKLIQVKNQLTPFSDLHPHLNQGNQLLTQACMELEEAYHDYKHYLDTAPNEQSELEKIDATLTKLHDLARHHKTQPENLLTTLEELRLKQHQLEHQSEYLHNLQTELSQLQTHYDSVAETLSQKRQHAGESLDKGVNQWLKQLGLPHGILKTSLSKKQNTTPQRFGAEHVAFLIQTHPEQPFMPLQKIASGGEMSRIALALQVITAQQFTLPTLIFDEVDTGISGQTAHIVGQLLQQLGQSSQVLCITHLPQVAAAGHHHVQIQKSIQKKTTTVTMDTLSKSQRIKSIAHMLDGENANKTVQEHAKQLLKNQSTAEELK